MALTRPSPNNAPPVPPEGMRWVWHAAGAEWVLDAALPAPKLSRWERWKPRLEEPANGPGMVLGAIMMVLSGPFMFLCALGAFAALMGVAWFFAQFGIG